MEKDKNIHAGHRGRLLDLVYKAGLDNVSPVQQVEHFLTYIFPRGDMNPLAHRLLDKFGCFANIVNASLGELLSIKGINKRSAMRIMGVPIYYQLYESQVLSQKENLNLFPSLCDYCEGILRVRPIEELHILALNTSGELIRDDCLARGKINYVGIPASLIINFIASTNPTYIVLIHNHPGGKAKPSDKDIDGTKYLKDVVLLNGANFTEHLIVGTDGVYGIDKKKYLRTYEIDGVDISNL